ncbi:hypothetical protein GCM10010264_73150 [Streptomyces globisporus]|uniref:hypothetical protein n=1 Tax=Streptomyces globisporus TaxID=1908 RepID=UPI0017846149|nr:hypothetical protein GCM10010264_73150 [Streptomyces globisporus]
MTDVKIIRCTEPDELYRHYDGQSEPQGTYIELDLQQESLLADYDAEVGSGSPAAVRHGFERRYAIPVLTGEAANRVMEEIAPLAARMLADWEEIWDGNNMVARLGDDARAAEAEIEEHLGLGYGGKRIEFQGFGDGDLVGVWGVDGATNGYEAEEYGITAGTTSERLDEIAAKITGDLAECGESPVAVVHGLDEYLRGLRAELAEQSA